MVVNFRFERATKNTVRYQEEGGPPFAVGALYVQHWALKDMINSLVLPVTASKTTEGWPQRLKVTIEPQV